MNWSGFEIGEDYVKPMSHISNALASFPIPANKTDLRAFMALAQQVSYATAVAPKLLPFRELLKKDAKWTWDPKLNDVFLATRASLAKQVEEGIKSYDPKKTTALVTDFYKNGVGFLLMQKHCTCKKMTEAGKLDALCCKTGWKVCMVGSRFTKKSESNYTPTEGELLGVVNALQKTKFFTLGCPDLFIGTDHKPLIGLLENTDLESMDNPRLLRLKVKTFGWQFGIVYIPGKEIGGTDTLSRYGIEHKEDECLDTLICNNDDWGLVSNRKHLVSLLSAADTNDDAFNDSEEYDVVSAVGVSNSPISWQLVKQSTGTEEGMRQLVEYIKKGFPESKDYMHEDTKRLWSIRSHLLLWPLVWC